MRALVPLLLALCGAAYVAHLALAGSGYALHVLTVAGCFALLAIGYQLVFGHAGALSLAQGSFMGIGAYISAILALRWGLGLAAALPVSVGGPALLALLVAAPVLRLRMHYFALATLILAQLALLAATQWESVTGGANGLAGMAVGGRWAMLGLTWACVGLGAALAWGMMRGQLGAAFAVIRRDPAAAAAIGIDAGRLRLLAFVLGAAFAGLAGSLYVHAIGVISPDILSFPVMVTCLTIVVVGSPRRIAGAIAGAVLVVELPEWFRFIHDWYLIAYGAAVLLVVIVAPDGLIGAAERLLPARRSTPPAPVALAAGPLSRGTLRIEALRRNFGGLVALDDVSLEVGPGEVVGLIGPNGSGKSTLINLVSGIYRPDAGRILFAGSEITNALPHRIARLGLARSFQTPTLVEDMSALETVAVAREPALIGPFRALSARPRDRRHRAEAMGLLDRVGIVELAGLACAALPQAARRRVEIARALALRPALILLDEPAAGLNPPEQAALATLLRSLAQEGIALLVVEHSMGFLAGLADRLVCLDAGRVIASGSPAAVQSDPRVIEAYLGGPAP